MNVLVINGDYLQKNSSANLCHLAYINGLLEAGHDVTLLSADGRDYIQDKAMIIPPTVKQYTYYGVSLYEKLSLRKQAAASTAAIPQGTLSPAGETRKKSGLSGIVSKLKSLFLSMYGVHGIYATFVRKAQAFRLDEEFDYILSISTPVTSHLLAHNLLKAGHIKGKHWIQIWEDPWHSDVYGFNGKDKIRREEEKLLSFAEKVCYVSPLTLQNQKRSFPQYAHKMFWQPLPCYYKADETSQEQFENNHYGYFGYYYPSSRDLRPFYEAANKTEISVNICGNPSTLFVSTKTVQIYPRLPLDKLKPIEDNTNVLVFLCNRKGGQIPGKIYQYSATDKTILFIMDGTPEEQAVLKDFFGKYNRYVFCQNNTEDIIRAIERIEAGDLGGVENKPLDVFDPVKTINNILAAGSE